MKRFIVVLSFLLIFTLFACNRSNEIETPVHNHNYDSDWDSDDLGHWKNCSCGESDSKTLHRWDEGVITKESSCTEEGTKLYSCLDCGKTKEESVSLSSHSFSDEYKYDSSSHWFECSCGMKKSVVAHNYDKGEVIKDATEEDFGVIKFTCLTCGYTHDEQLEKLEHTHKFSSNWSSDESGHWHSSTCEHDVQSDYSKHTGGTASCKELAKCSVCGTSYGEYLEHSFTNYVSNRNATCTVDGTKTAKCDYCDATDTIVDEGSAIGHSFTNYVSNNDATCTLDGTKTAKCDSCDETNTITDQSSALGHNFVNYVSNNDATCTANGTKTAKCERCENENTIIDSGSKLEHNYSNYSSNGDATCTIDGTKTAKCDNCDITSTITDEGSALGHDYESVVTAPTCLQAGYTTHTCSRCDHDYTDSNVAPLGHSFTNYVSNNDATCILDGTKTAKCDRCDVTDTETDLGSALGHDFKSVVTEPTCLEVGYTTHTCDRCDYDYVDSNVEALGHDYESVVTAPTCLQAGYTTHTCSRCDSEYTDGNVDALGHSFTNYVSNNDATCISDGTKTAKCDRCDITDTITDEDSMKDHSYKETWSFDGKYHWHECSVCETADTKETHEWNNGEVIEEATEEKEGISRFTCNYCGAIEDRNTGKLDHEHKYSDLWSSDEIGHWHNAICGHEVTSGYGKHTGGTASCTELAKCNDCGASYGELEKHSFTNYVSNNDATCISDGTKTAKCDNCDATDTIADLGSALGHDYESVVTSPTCLETGVLVD